MLQSLTIQNYALINQLEISFNKGFSTITGETGAGKSILMGALSLLVGQRADASVQLDKTRKCVVEGVFNIANYQLRELFINNDIDYNDELIIRREIIDASRSRAFVNDSPVNLTLLKDLGDRLIDVHSQHQNLLLTNNLFQLKIIDTLANNQTLAQTYKQYYQRYYHLCNELEQIKRQAQQSQADLDYLQFQFNELEQAKLKSDELIVLEEEIKILQHAEEIKLYLGNTAGILNAEQTGIVVQLKECINALHKIKNAYPNANTLIERTQSVYFELKDLAAETEQKAEQVEIDPERLLFVKERLDLLYALCQKHKVATDAELINICQSLQRRLNAISSFDETIATLTNEIESLKLTLKSNSQQLSERRKNVKANFELQITEILQSLGIPNAAFIVQFDALPDFTATGTDKISFLFSANKQTPPNDIAKVASGGEISRVMLAIKAVAAGKVTMPTVIFDEIDTGVSGDIAEKMGSLMKTMAANMQVLSITHLPQVAACGNYQYKVFKTETETATNTQIKLLDTNQRVTEIAKMLSGKDISEAALTNAKVLLGL